MAGSTHPLPPHWHGSRAPVDTRTFRPPRMRRQNLALAGVGLLATLVFGVPTLPAGAATTTATFAVTATIQATCLITATALAFGTYTGTQADATSTLSVTCTNTTPYNVGLSAGAGTGATVTARKMTGPGAALLGYALFSDAGRVQNWGTTIGTDTLAGTGNGNAQTLTVYGRVAAGQLIAPGAYTDTVTATITY
jgi:spore coat protein U-like protein